MARDPGTNSTHVSGLPDGQPLTREQAMAAYDRLPKNFRELLQQSIVDCDPVAVLTSIYEGHSYQSLLPSFIEFQKLAIVNYHGPNWRQKYGQDS